MKSNFVKNLKPGDEVTWIDPDMGTCNATGIIQSIEILSVDNEITDDTVVKITFQDGRYIEAYPQELI